MAVGGISAASVVDGGGSVGHGLVNGCRPWWQWCWWSYGVGVNIVTSSSVGRGEE